MHTLYLHVHVYMCLHVFLSLCMCFMYICASIHMDVCVCINLCENMLVLITSCYHVYHRCVVLLSTGLVREDIMRLYSC